MTTDKADALPGLPFTVRALDDHVIAVECPTEYTRSKPSFLVPDEQETHASLAANGPGRWSLETAALRVEVDAEISSVRVYRTAEGSADPVCELREPTPDGASVVIDRGFPLYGVGGNNAIQLRTTHDMDLLTDVDLDRRDKVYRIHHRETGQGVNFMPWVLSTQGFGVLVDSSYPMTLDLRDRFRVDSRNIRTYYFIDGPTPAETVGRMVKLTGLPPMHPAWALGYEQSSRTWMNPGELDFVTTLMREKRIPCDGLVLLSTYGGQGAVGRSASGFHAGYPDMYQGWNPYGSYTEYNPNLLPGGAEDIRRLRERGYHPIVHGYWASDYSDPDACEEVWQQHKYLYEDGWEGWWLDGTEHVNVGRGSRRTQSYLPDYDSGDMAKFEDKEFLDEYDNVWALLRAKTFYEKQRRDFPDRRVYILNRSAFIGMQRYAVGCNQGDFWSSWEMMLTQTAWLLNMQMSGIFFPESDIGGFFPTEHLTDELFIRWAFMGVFGPLMRSHGVNWRIRLPWGFGPENEARFVPLIRLRSSMFPYNYTLLSQANRTGIPMMRAMALEFPGDLEARKLFDQFTWGPDVLVAPVYRKGDRERSVYLPEGRWLHYWTMKPYDGPSRVTVDAPLGRDPWFVRVGTVLPMREPSDTIPTESDDHLILLATPGQEEGGFTLYDDDRQSYAYERGESSRQTFTYLAGERGGGLLPGDRRGGGRPRGHPALAELPDRGPQVAGRRRPRLRIGPGRGRPGPEGPLRHRVGGRRGAAARRLLVAASS